MDDTRRSYDTIAADYAAAMGDELAGKPLDRALLLAFAEGVSGPIADVGAGPGQVGRFLAVRGHPVVAIDLSTGMCRVGSAANGDTALPFAAMDMTALAIRTGGLGGLLSFYALIHLDPAGRRRAYAEFARVLRPGGLALLAFHVRDAETATGASRTHSRWWERPVALRFHFLDPVVEANTAAGSGLALVATLTRRPGPDEHASDRAYVLLRRSDAP